MSDALIKILIVEDRDDDFELICCQLRQDELNVDCRRVDSAAQLREALQEQSWDAILADYHLPGFSGLEALEIHKSTGRDIPFLFLSGTIGEDSVVECMKAGANDLIVKGQPRLLPALRRELQEAQNRRARRFSEDRYKRIVESASEGIWTSDPQGILTFVNGKMAELLQKPVSELVGHPVFDFMTPTAAETLRSRMWRETRSELPLALEFIRAEGLSETISTLSLLEEGGFLSTVTDMTQMRALERKLLHSAKMEAIGRLAAGVAHDFNNTLSVILGFTEILLGGELDEDLRQDVESIAATARSATSMTRQMMAVGRQQKMTPVRIHLNATLEEHHRMLVKAAGENVSLHLRASAEVDEVEIDPDMLSQVLFNLVMNARDALGKEGKIVVSTHYLALDKEAAGSVNHELTPGDYVVLAVSDNGHGMDSKTRTQIFEPFFTTKPSGQGTGLGLSSVYGMVRQSGGHIWVYSEPGLGTTFKIYFPAFKSSVEQSHGQSSDRPHGDFTVLLVDDSDPTRKVMRECLVRDGYQVLEARDGEEAVELALGFPGLIELAICDVTMPRMAGPEVAEILLRKRPEMDIIFTSGQGAEFCALPDLEALPHEFVEKPILPKNLVTRVRTILSRRPPGPKSKALGLQQCVTPPLEAASLGLPPRLK